MGEKLAGERYHREVTAAMGVHGAVGASVGFVATDDMSDIEQQAKQILLDMATDEPIVFTVGQSPTWKQAVLYCADQGWLRRSTATHFYMMPEGWRMRDSLTRSVWARVWAHVGARVAGGGAIVILLLGLVADVAGVIDILKYLNVLN